MRIVSASVDHDLVQEEEAAPGAAVGVVADVSRLVAADGGEFLEEQFRGGDRDVVPDCPYQGEVFPVFRNEDVHFGRHEDARADELHEGASDVADLPDCSEVYSDVYVGQEALPASVAVGPASDDAVGECGFAGCRIPLLDRSVVNDLAAFCLMFKAGLSEFALSIFLIKVKDRISL